MRPIFSQLVLYAVLIAMLNAGARNVRADLIYDDGPINGTLGGYPIGGPTFYFVTDSFTVSAESNLTKIEHAGMWTSAPAAPSSVIWLIGTSPLSFNIASGVSSISSSYFGSVANIYNVYDTNFNINATVGPGTYFFALVDAQDPFGGYVYWDLNNGPSTALIYAGHYLSIGAESFQIHGFSALVPEPSSFVLLACGSLAVALCVRRQRLLFR